MVPYSCYEVTELSMFIDWVVCHYESPDLSGSTCLNTGVTYFHDDEIENAWQGWQARSMKEVKDGQRSN